MTMHQSFFKYTSISVPVIQRYAEDISRVTGKICSFSTLRKGWHYGDGDGPSQATIYAAIEVAKILQMIGADKINAFPEVEGSVMVNSDIKGQYKEFVCHSLDKIEILDDCDINDSKELNFTQLVNSLKDCPWSPESSLGWFTQSTSTSGEVDFPHRRSAGQKLINVSQ